MRIIPLGGLSPEEAALAGGKARGLDFMKKKGYRIADGFVVMGLRELGEEEGKALLRAFCQLGAERVSVRSSATSEDGSELSSAGQYETCLNVTEDGFCEAVRHCLASLYGERAAAYAEAMKTEGGGEMNLVVEAMVDARAAGVMFTRDPADRDAVLIESVDGLGENLVSGHVAAYRYSVARDEFSFPEVDGNLDAALLERIYREGLAIGELFGQEADLEWAVDKDGMLFWLQLRPITALGGADVFEFDPKEALRGHLFTSRNVGEMLPGAVTPLSISTSVLAIDYGIRDMMRYVGCMKHADDMPEFSIILPFGYHLFFDMTKLHGMKNHVKMATADAMNLSIMGEYYKPCPEPEGTPRNIVTRLLNCAKFGKYLFSSKRACREAEEIASSLSFKEKDTAAELYREIDAKLPVMNEVLCRHYICSSFSGSMNSTLMLTLAKDFESKEDYQAFVASILSDIDGIESADILRALRELAAAVLAVKPDAASLSEEELVSLLHNGEYAEVSALYRAFLEKHGHRSIKEAELRSRGWRDDEVALARNLHAVLVGGLSELPHTPYDPATLYARFGLVKRKSLGWIGKNARRAVCEREYTKSRIIRVIDGFKVQYRKLAAMLVADGLLADADLIYFLTHKEIGRLLLGESSLAERAAERRTAFSEAEELSYSDVSIGKPKPIDPSSADGEAVLHGAPVSRGRVVGRARIVRSVEDAEALTNGEVMVAAFTDIGWSPYYSIISALVTEVGSALSHGAVVAREYGLPTVVNAKGATVRIKTGDPVLVDATHGTVTLLSEEEYAEELGKVAVAV